MLLVQVLYVIQVFIKRARGAQLCLQILLLVPMVKTSYVELVMLGMLVLLLMADIMLLAAYYVKQVITQQLAHLIAHHVLQEVIVLLAQVTVYYVV
jgi:hypothetical protein